MDNSIDLDKYLNDYNNNLNIYNELCKKLYEGIDISMPLVSKMNFRLEDPSLKHLEDCLIKLTRSVNSIYVLCPKNLDFFKIDSLLNTVDFDIQTIATIARNILEIHRFSIYISGISNFNDYTRINEEELSFRHLLYKLHSNIEYLKSYNSIKELVDNTSKHMNALIIQKNLENLKGNLLKNQYFSKTYYKKEYFEKNNRPQNSMKNKRKNEYDYIKSVFAEIDSKKFRFQNKYISYVDKKKLGECFDLSLPEEDYKILYSTFSYNLHFTLLGRECERDIVNTLFNFIDILILSVDTSLICLVALIELIYTYCKINNIKNHFFYAYNLSKISGKSTLSEWAKNKLKNLR